MSKGAERVIRVSDVEPYSPSGAEELFYSRMLIDNQSVGSGQIIVNEFTLKPGQTSYKGEHPAPYDEVYYFLHGEGVLVLVDSDERHYEVEPGVIAFIPSGVQHYLINRNAEKLVLLTIMPKLPVKGANSLYDSRIEEWHTSFRLRPNAKGVRYSTVKS